MASFLRKYINEYFQRQDFSIYTPGKDVVVEGYSVNLKLLLLSIGKSEPYKVFYRHANDEIEIFLVRHPRQNEL